MERRKFLASVGTVAATASLAGCSGFGGADEDTPAKNGTSQNKQVGVEENNLWDLEEQNVADDDEDALVIQNSRLVQTQNGAGVVGDVKNTGNETFTFLEVQATLYDESDDVLGEWIDNTEGEDIDSLAPGEVWDFEIWFENADLGSAASYSLSASGQVNGESGDTATGTDAGA